MKVIRKHLPFLESRISVRDDKCYHTINFRDEEMGELYTDLFELKILELSKLLKLSGETEGERGIRMLKIAI